MNYLHLRCDDVTLTAQLKSYLQDRLDQAIEKIRDRVHEVHLNIEDINGPNRKGLDKQAKLVVRWNNKQSLVIQDKDSKVGALIHRVLDRLEASIDRRMERGRHKRNSTDSKKQKGNN